MVTIVELLGPIFGCSISVVPINETLFAVHPMFVDYINGASYVMADGWGS